MRRIAFVFALAPLFAFVACDRNSIQVNCECNPYIPLKGTWNRSDSIATVMLDTNGIPGDSGLSIEGTLITFTADGKVTATRTLKFLDTQKHVLVMDTTTPYAGTWQTPLYNLVVFHWTTDPLFGTDTLNFTPRANTLRFTSPHASIPDTLIYTRQ